VLLHFQMGDKTDYNGGTRTMIHLPHDGLIRIVAVTQRNCYPWSTDTKVLLQTTEGQAQGDELTVLLVCDEDGHHTQKGKPNKHVLGLWGDCYIQCVIDTRPPEPENEDDDWPDESYRIGERIPHKLIACALEALNWKQNIMFSPYHAYFHRVLDEVVQKYKCIVKDNKAGMRQLPGVIEDCLRSMDHRHIERTTIEDTMFIREHADIMIKSKEALVYAFTHLFNTLRTWAVANGASVVLAVEQDKCFPAYIPDALPNPSLTCTEFGDRMQPFIVRLYEDYFRSLDTLAMSEAEVKRRKQETERREKEAITTRTAAAARKKQRLLEERIARLEKEENRPYSKPGATKLSHKWAKSRVRTKEEQTVHDHHISDEDKVRRKAIFDAKQELAHLTAETNRFEKTQMKKRDEEKREGAARALNAHVVPGKAKVSDFVPSA
jgi:hypothetical protein